MIFEKFQIIKKFLYGFYCINDFVSNLKRRTVDGHISQRLRTLFLYSVLNFTIILFITSKIKTDTVSPHLLITHQIFHRNNDEVQDYASPSTDLKLLSPDCKTPMISKYCHKMR